MSSAAISTLVVGPPHDDALRRAVDSLGYVVEAARDGDEAVRVLESAPARFAVALVEGASEDSLHAVRAVRRREPELPIILVCDEALDGLTALALESGATASLRHPVADEELRTAIRQALEGGAPAGRRVRAFMGKSPAMAAIASVLGHVARSDAPVLIQGETGSGKEVIAREIHAASPRSKRAFFKLNCAALPSELVESELFGYERGAFTGAAQRKTGIFEAADGGTILLDEIGDMDVRLQAKLLQVLQDQAFQRIGGRETIHVDVRVIAATHRHLENAIQLGTFREDLYYRLNVVALVAPPLRDRPEDLIELTRFLLQRHAKPGEPIPFIPPELETAMLAWRWPGNVRELENFARRLLIFRDPSRLAQELRDRANRRAAASPWSGVERRRADRRRGSDRPATVFSGDALARLPALAAVDEAKRQAEAEAIRAALHAAHWNRKLAASMLHTKYKSLLYKMKTLGIDHAPADAEEGAP